MEEKFYKSKAVLPEFDLFLQDRFIYAEGISRAEMLEFLFGAACESEKLPERVSRDYAYKDAPVLILFMIFFARTINKYPIMTMDEPAPKSTYRATIGYINISNIENFLQIVYKMLWRKF